MRPRNALLTLAVLAASMHSQAQVNANFSATPTSGCAPVVVSFTDLSTGSPNYWEWWFGNSNVSFSQNPSAAYINPGTYTVTLIVSDGTNWDTLTLNNLITVFADPVAAFAANPLGGCLPLQVQFTDNSIPGDGAIDQWFWDFGDGNFSTIQNPTHVYANAGVYSVSLIVTDVNGCTDDITLTNLINVTPKPFAGFSALPLTGCDVPHTVTFSNYSTGAPPLSYMWDFGDGNTSSAATPVHDYNTFGQFTVSLIVTNGAGCTDTMIRPVYIHTQPVIPAFTMSASTVCRGEAVAFTNQSTGFTGTYSYLWDFGDGSTSNVENTSHAYQTPGTFTVTLTVTSSLGCTESTTQVITVEPAPTADFSGMPLFACDVPLAVAFTDLSTGAVSWDWSFGDGGTSTLQNPTHIYTVEGSFNVMLTVTGPNGCTHDTTFVDYVTVDFPDADFSAWPVEGCVPLDVQFNDLSTSTDPIVSWEWGFGDGNTSVLQDPLNTYSTTGTFTVTLIITTASGCTDTLTRPNYIRTGNPPIVNFTATPLLQCLGDSLFFTDLSVGGNEWFWDFGDGSTSWEQHPGHAYNDTGTFDVTLIVWDNGCSDTLTIPNYITIVGPRADFSYSIDCADPYTVVFTDQSAYDPDTYFWEFGDGNTSTLQNPTHTYAATGTYNVVLTVTDTVNGCVDTVLQVVTIADIAVDFSATPLAGCAPLTVTFTDLSTDAVIWHWDFGDNGIDSTQNPVHGYAQNGVYTVTLIVTDANGCRDTLTRPNYVTVAGPLVGFYGSPVTGCAPLDVTFTDTSVSPGSNIITWFWSFGDGATSTQQHPTHTYANAGNYNVTLVVTDDAGCSGTVTQLAYVIATDPIAQFTSVPFACPNDLLPFANQSTGLGLSFVWDFGDGDSSTVANPSHLYADTGTYNVKLVVTDIFGCRDSMTAVVDVRPPLADFGAAPTFASCPPLTVNFTDSSQGNIISWLWSFGDGSFSTLQNPSHTYVSAGSFDVTLIVTTSLNCTDTIRMDDLVTIQGPQGTFSFSPDFGCVPVDVTFDASALNTVNYTWDFGDGTVVTTPDSFFTHTYNIPGVFHPVMVLDDGLGCVVGIGSPDSIVVDQAIADFSASTLQLCNSGTVDLTSLSFGWSGVATWEWGFGDGTTSNAFNPAHTYAAPGSYDITHVITSNLGCTDTMIQPSLISVYDVQAVFDSDTFFCGAPQDARFTDLSISTDSIVSWQWTFGDGDSSTLQSDIHTYDSTGLYTAQLVIETLYGCTDSVSQVVGIYPRPNAAFGADAVCHGDTTTITDLSTVGLPSVIATWDWDFGDGNASTVQHPVYQYQTPGNYGITLTVTTDAGCSDTTTQPVSIFALPVPAALSDTALCFGDTAQVSATGGASYLWTPSLGLGASTQPATFAAPDSTTQYIVEVTDANGCVAYDSVLITVNPLPVADAGPDHNFCVGEYAVLNGSGGVSYQWLPAVGLSCLTCPNPTAFPNDTTNYILRVTDANGCRAVDSVLVGVMPLPVVSISPDVTICVGDTAALSVAGGVGYAWSPNATVDCDTCSSTFAAPQTTTVFVAEVTGANGCTSADSLAVTVLPYPNALTTGDATICRGQSLGISASGGVSYSWQPPLGLSCTNCANPIASPQQTSTYIVEVSNGFCSGFDTLTITVLDTLPAEVGPDTTICAGGSADLWAQGTPGAVTQPMYDWSPFSSLSSRDSSHVIATPSATTTYTVVISSGSCAPATRTVTVQVDALPEVDAGEDRVTFVGMPANLDGTGSGNGQLAYQWSPPDPLDCPTCTDPIANVTSTTTFELTVTDENGCMKTDSMQVRLIDRCEGALVFVPNTFTPNADGVNDQLYVRSYGVQEITAFRVFDRWGELLFATRDQSQGWDGTYNGETLKPAVFVYTVEGICLNDEQFVSSGNVAIVK